MNFVFHRRKNVIWVWNNMIIFIFGWTMHLKPCPGKTYHKPVDVDPCAGLCWQYIHTIKQETAQKQITQIHRGMRSWTELKATYISVSDFNEALWLLRVHIIHCPYERKTPKATLIYVPELFSPAKLIIMFLLMAHRIKKKKKKQKCEWKIIRTLPLQTGK